MTNAIARWHSEAPLAVSNQSEQAYADRLEGQLQEMAVQLHKVVYYLFPEEYFFYLYKLIRNIFFNCNIPVLNLLQLTKISVIDLIHQPHWN